MPFDTAGLFWEPIEEYEAEQNYNYTQAELDQTTAEMEAWKQTPEGKAFEVEWQADQAARRERQADPNRLTNRADVADFPLIFAQAVQSIFDETGEPCRLKEAGERAEMDSDEYVIAAAYATVQGLVRSPVRNGYICTQLFEPAVG